MGFHPIPSIYLHPIPPHPTSSHPTPTPLHLTPSYLISSYLLISSHISPNHAHGPSPLPSPAQLSPAQPSPTRSDPIRSDTIRYDPIRYVRLRQESWCSYLMSHDRTAARCCCTMLVGSAAAGARNISAIDSGAFSICTTVGAPPTANTRHRRVLCSQHAQCRKRTRARSPVRCKEISVLGARHRTCEHTRRRREGSRHGACGPRPSQLHDAARVPSIVCHPHWRERRLADQPWCLTVSAVYGYACVHVIVNG